MGLNTIETGPKKTMKIVRTLIVDDNAAFRHRIKDSLASQQDIEVIGEAANGREAISKARELMPDLILMDIRMPVMNGLIATRQIKEEMPTIKIIILSIIDLQEYQEAAITDGADGYVIKAHINEELIPAIRNIIKSVTKFKEG